MSQLFARGGQSTLSLAKLNDFQDCSYTRLSLSHPPKPASFLSIQQTCSHPSMANLSTNFSNSCLGLSRTYQIYGIVLRVLQKSVYLILTQEGLLCYYYHRHTLDPLCLCLFMYSMFIRRAKVFLSFSSFFFRAKVFYLNESPLSSAFNFFYIGNLPVTKKRQF